MSKLAIKGGEPVRKKPFSAWPIYDEREEQGILGVLKSGNWWRGGEQNIPTSKVRQFEEKFARYHDATYGVAVTNGTAAIEVALKAGGIGAGDEVIVPAYTFIATATAVLTVNAIPIFVDIDPDTYCIDPEEIEKAISPKTKAVIPVQFAGNISDMDRINEIAQRYNLLVIEDCAQAHGSKWNNKGVGSLGDMGTFSFQQSKNMTAGEGGIVITNNEDLALKCYSYHHIGRLEGRPFYEHHRLAGNERMTEFQAVILLTQLERLNEQTDIREKNARYLSEQLSKIPGIGILSMNSKVTKRGYYIYIFKYFSEKLKDISREKFIKALEAEGIPCSSGYPLPLYANPLFKEAQFSQTGCPLSCQYYAKEVDYSAIYCPEAERAIYKEQVWLPHPCLLGDRKGMDDIVRAVEKIKENIDEIA